MSYSKNPPLAGLALGDERRPLLRRRRAVVRFRRTPDQAPRVLYARSCLRRTPISACATGAASRRCGCASRGGFTSIGAGSIAPITPVTTRPPLRLRRTSFGGGQTSGSRCFDRLHAVANAVSAASRYSTRPGAAPTPDGCRCRSARWRPCRPHKKTPAAGGTATRGSWRKRVTTRESYRAARPCLCGGEHKRDDEGVGLSRRSVRFTTLGGPSPQVGNVKITPGRLFDGK
jgi:hypothetical protein